MAEQDDVFRVVFVCTGNICRSPMADVVFRAVAARKGLADRVASSSAGTGEWHVGELSDARTRIALTQRGYDGEAHRARQFTSKDFGSDLVIALDRSHERILQSWAASEDESDRISLLMSFAPTSGGVLDVPDPYYADQGMFDDVLVMIEHAIEALFAQLEPALRASGD